MFSNLAFCFLLERGLSSDISSLSGSAEAARAALANAQSSAYIAADAEL